FTGYTAILFSIKCQRRDYNNDWRERQEREEGDRGLSQALLCQMTHPIGLVEKLLYKRKIRPKYLLCF
ncbi:MAG: hypothetical protein Q4D60_06135, partial [Eubacteriales bacterium]|nr:hypothetical protein [Eubacteriales bacterium]